MLRWTDNASPHIYGYAGNVHLFTIHKEEESHPERPWRLRTIVPYVNLSGDDQFHLSRGDAKAQAEKIMKKFLDDMDAVALHPVST